MSFELVESKKYSGILCDFYAENGEIYLTREQIGRALEYADPSKAIQKIHMSHKDRLERHCFREQTPTIKTAENGDSHDHPHSGGSREDAEFSGRLQNRHLVSDKVYYGQLPRT